MDSLARINDTLSKISRKARAYKKVYFLEGVNIFESCRSLLALKLQEYERGSNLNDIVEPYASIKTTLVISKKIIEYLKFRPRNIVDVVFWPQRHLHLKQQLIIAEHLNNNKIKYKFVTDKRIIYKKLKSKGQPTSMLDWLPYDSSKKSYFSLIESTTKIILSDIKGINESHKKIIINILQNNFFRLKKCVKDTNIVLKYYNPKLVFLGNDLLLDGSTIAQRLKINEITSASIMHGNLTTALHKNHVVDKFFTFGKKDKNSLMDLGLKKDKVIVSGAPHLANLNINYKKKLTLSLLKIYL